MIQDIYIDTRTAIQTSIERNTQKIEELVQYIVETFDVNIDLFYYSIGQGSNILVINSIEEKGKKHVERRILEEINNFADENLMLLSINLDVDLIENYEDLGYNINTNFGLIPESIIRYPIIKKQINESVSVFGSFTIMKDIKPKAHQIQSTQYLDNWYDTYINIINSEEYKKKRKKETDSAFLFRNPKRCTPAKVGFAIVGQSKIGDCN